MAYDLRIVHETQARWRRESLKKKPVLVLNPCPKCGSEISDEQKDCYGHPHASCKGNRIFPPCEHYDCCCGHEEKVKDGGA